MALIQERTVNGTNGERARRLLRLLEQDEEGPEKEREIKLFSIVRLRSCGPEMTVINLASGDNGIEARCLWFQSDQTETGGIVFAGSPCERTFPLGALELRG